MTRKQLITILCRRWYAVVVVLLCTVAGMNFIHQSEGVYWTQVDVVFLPPTNATGGNVLQEGSSSLVHFAAIVDREYNGSNIPPQASTSGGTLYGVGVRSGSSVVLPNAGSQWATNFNRPVLTVEVVDSSPERVQVVLNNVLDRLDHLAATLQENSGVSPAEFIHLQRSPQEADVSYIRGSRIRAYLAAGLLGLGLSISAAVLVEQGLSRRKRRRESGSTAPKIDIAQWPIPDVRLVDQ